MHKVKKSFPPEYHLINDILMQWNPLGVDDNVLSDEYVAFIPRLLKVREDLELTVATLESILTKELGMAYDSSDNRRRSEVMDVALQIHSLR